jgi:RNA polymerase sigma-70 factor, ECF subfamily
LGVKLKALPRVNGGYRPASRRIGFQFAEERNRRKRARMFIVDEAATFEGLDKDSLTESEAIRLAQQGSETGFSRIYELYSRRVYALCLRMTGSKADAEDLTQEAFLQAFRRIETFRFESSFFTWLHRVSVNIVLMHFRKKPPAENSVEEMTERDALAGRPTREFGRADHRLSGLIDRLSLRWAIEQLPPGYRMAFLLHDVEGYNHTEIAGILSCSVGNSKSQLHKARLRLRKLLRDALRNRVPRHVTQRMHASLYCELAT